MHGSHLVHHWSSSQKVVASSPAEAELDAIVKSMTDILCLMNVDERVWKTSQRTDLDGQLRRKWNSPSTRLRQGETFGMPTAVGPMDCWRRQSDLHERWPD